jgi:hypothetical protein
MGRWWWRAIASAVVTLSFATNLATANDGLPATANFVPSAKRAPSDVTGPPLHISIETWRWLPHSYAIIGMNVALVLRKRQLQGTGGVQVSFADPPPLVAEGIDWRGKRHMDLLSPPDLRLLASIPLTKDAPYQAATPHAVFKIAFPFNTSSMGGLARQPFIFTYGTVEKKRCQPNMLSADSPDWADVRVRMITPSQWSADGLVKCGVPPEKIDVIPNGFDPDVFYPPSTAERRAAYVVWRSRVAGRHYAAGVRGRRWGIRCSGREKGEAAGGPVAGVSARPPFAVLHVELLHVVIESTCGLRIPCVCTGVRLWATATLMSSSLPSAL